MKNKKLYKKILGISLCFCILLNMAPKTVYSASTSVPGAVGHTVTDIVTGTFSEGYDSTILVYSTPNSYNSIKYNIDDAFAVFEIPSYDSNQWYFDGWRTWYKGSQLGAGVITSDKANPKFSDDLNYFEESENVVVSGGEYYKAGSMKVYKESNWKGTYYLSAIFKPIVTINIGEGATYTFSVGTAIENNKYGVTYGDNATINYSITDNKYMVTGVSVSYGTTYSEKNGQINVNGIVRPTTVTIHTALKPKATCTAPTANNLTYNNKEQELVNKGISNEGVLMYSLEENGAYSENIPTAKNVGKYTVWYYVKGDNNHNDSDISSVEVEIKKGNPDIGTVSAKIPNNTTDTSEIVLKRTDETIPGNLKVKDGQTLVFGDNEIEYIFIPDDDKYKEVEGTVNVTVSDTEAPTGEVTITDAKTAWDKILEKITFNLYFNKDQKVEVNATDRLSGIASIEYFESKEVLDLNAIKLLSDENWKTMDVGGVKVTAEDAKQFIYYIRLADKAGNISIISTDGAVFDVSAPVISGVEDGKTYNTTQTITITDKNLDNVKLNGEEATDLIVLEEDKEGTFVVVATDKAGNSSTVTVKIGKLEETGKPSIDDSDKDDADTTTDNKVTNKPTVNNPQTGDDIMLFVIIALISVVGIIATIKAKKYVKNN